MEWRNLDPPILGTRREDAVVWLGDHFLGILLSPHYSQHSGIWWGGILSRMVQNHCTYRVLLHLIPRQCRCIWKCLHWISVLDSSRWYVSGAQHQVGSIADYVGPVVNGSNGFGQVFVLASAYYVGTEIISLAVGETKDSRKSIPRVCVAPNIFTVMSLTLTGRKLGRVQNFIRVPRPHFLPRPLLLFELARASQCELNRCFLSIHDRLCSRWVEVGRTVHQRSHHYHVHFSGEWVHICPVTSALFSCVD